MTLPDSIFRAVFEQAAEAIVVVDRRGVPALWNVAFDALFRTLAGVGPERLENSFYSFLASRGCERFDYYAAEALLGGWRSASFESPIRAADGTRRWLRFALSLVESPDFSPGEPPERFLACTAEDVTDRVLREARLRDAKEEAEKATHTKSQFLANMSHEIRTPIQTILGVVELLQETRLDTEQSEYANQVRFSADILLGLINDILDFSKIEAGKFDLEVTDFDLRSCVRQSVDMLVMDAHRKSLEILLDMDERLPQLVRGDPGRLRQIIVNLFKNAIKFTVEGGIFLSLRRLDRGETPFLRLEVADTGPGVPESVRDKLFTPFVQGDFPQTRKMGGTGLGLAISRHLVELMGGAIGLRPNDPVGSVFWFEIPLVVPEFSAAPPPPARMPRAQTPSPGSRVLVVDDHALARAQAARIAASAGYSVAEAASGEEALAALREAAARGEGFAACLIDQNMPRMDGWRLASEITGDTAINSARLVLMAPVGTIGADAKMKLLRWFNGYLSKPVGPVELLDALAKALSSEVDLEPAEAGESSAAGGERRFPAEVLVAEDHEVNRELFALLLAKLGCRVTEARDGLEAVELGSAKRFDIVLMDIVMPRMNGYEAARALRDRGYGGPIIAVTASALKGERENCVAAGMNDILVKPFKKSDLAGILAAWLVPEEAVEEAEPIEEDEPEELLPIEEESQPVAPIEGGPAPSEPGAEAQDRASALPDTAVFDWSGVLDTFLGQGATVANLLSRFIEKAGAQMGDLAASLAAKDLQRFRETAHSIKGAAWNLSARRLGDAAMAAEKAGAAGDARAAESALGTIREAFAEFSAAAAPFARRGDPPR